MKLISMKTWIIFVMAVWPAMLNAAGMRLTISPGELSSHRSSIFKESPASLTVTGNGDVRDLRFIADSLPPCVAAIDLSDLNILNYVFPITSDEPRTVYPEGVIPSATFAFSRFSSFILPRNTSEIGEAAFAGSEISEITFPENLKTIGEYAFAGCLSLKKVNAPHHSLTRLGKGAFENCPGLNTIDMSDTWLEKIGEHAFAGCTRLSEIRFPPTLRRVETEAFAGTCISQINFPFEVRTAAFGLSSMPYLEKVSLDWAPLTAEGIFLNTPRLQSVEGVCGDLPALFAAGSGVTEASTFYYAETFGAYSLTSIPADSLKFGRQLRYIGTEAFSRMKNLRSIDVTMLDGTIPQTEEKSFDGITPSDITLAVNSRFLDIWKEHPQWSLFKIVPIDVSGVDELYADTATGSIHFTLSGSKLTVRSGHPLRWVKIYSIDGRLLTVGSSGNREWTCDLAPYAGMVTIAEATDTEGCREIMKFIVEQ